MGSGRSYTRAPPVFTTDVPVALASMPASPTARSARVDSTSSGLTFGMPLMPSIASAISCSLSTSTSKRVGLRMRSHSSRKAGSSVTSLRSSTSTSLALSFICSLWAL